MSLSRLSGGLFKIGEENDFWEFYNCIFDVLEQSFEVIVSKDTNEKTNIDMIPFTAGNNEGEDKDSLNIRID